MHLLSPASLLLNVGQAGLFRVQEVDPKRFHYYAKFQKLSLATQLVSLSMSISSLYLELDKRWHLTSKLQKLVDESNQGGLRAVRPTLILKLALPLGLGLGGVAAYAIALVTAWKLNIFYHKEVGGLNTDRLPEGVTIEREHSGSFRQAAYLIQLGLDTCAFGFCRNPILLANGGVSLHNLLLLAKRQWVQLSATKIFEMFSHGEYTLKLSYSIAITKARANLENNCVVCQEPLKKSAPSFSFCPEHPPVTHDHCTLTNAATQLKTLARMSLLSLRIYKEGRRTRKTFTAKLIDTIKPSCPKCHTMPNGNTFKATVHQKTLWDDTLDTDAYLVWI